MKIFKKYKLEQAVSTDDYREILQNIQIEDGNAVATTGRILVSVPIEMEKGDSDGLISTRAFKSGRKVGKLSYFCLKLRKRWIQAEDKVIYPRGKGAFPGWKNLFKEIDGLDLEAVEEINFDAELLVTIQRALGANGIKLRFRGQAQAIEVLPERDGNGRGLFMPRGS